MLQIMYKRRSVRQYTAEPVTPEQTRQILAAALLAPTGHNKKPCRFIAVSDRELLDKLAAAKEYGADFLRQAPLAVVVTADGSLSDIWMEDAAIAAAYMQLAAEALGLNSCWSQIWRRPRRGEGEETQWAEDYLRDLFALAPQVHVLAIVAVGHGAGTKQARKEDDLPWGHVSYDTQPSGRSE
ncbi:MAG: nitroreductase family protein [Gracilibacteraceae bacterium]|nr:nitroreductase family protein [Gracilibacteraceae bacterium]